MQKRYLVLLPFFLLGSFRLSAADAPQPPPNPVDSIVPLASTTETKEQRDARMAWWREARFGMFIHWGLYAIPAGQWNGKPVKGLGEWIMRNGKIPVDDYAALAKQFNPTKFDADAWVAIAKAAGMKYIVITAKHHDGFAMYKSSNPYNVVDATPFHRDPLKELAIACQKQGIKLGFYYSQAQDWQAPGGRAGSWDPKQKGDLDTYLKDKVVPQLTELLTNYQPAPVYLWFDTPYEMREPQVALIAPILKQHPELIVNNRLGKGYPGDTGTPEQEVPRTPVKGDWETCMTLNDTWGYRSDDTHFKNSGDVLRRLIDITSKGGNFLLNVGPDATGTIPAPEVTALQGAGEWLKVNGEAIYGTGPTPWGEECGTYSPTRLDKNGKIAFDYKSAWRCTTKPGKYYISIFTWPKEAPHTITLPSIKEKIKTAYFLADPQKAPVPLTQTETATTLTLPEKSLDPLATVLVLDTTP